MLELTKANIIKKSLDPIKVAAISGGHFFTDIYMNLLPSIIPILVLEYNLSNTELGIMVATMSIVSNLLQPVFGYIMDKKVNTYILPLSLVWISVMMSLVGISKSYMMIVILTTLASIGSSIYHPLGSTMLSSAAGNLKGTAMSIYFFAGNLGLTIPPIIAIPMIQAYGMKSLLFLMIPGLLGAAFIYLRAIDPIDQKKSNNEIIKPQSSNKEKSLGKFKWVVFLNIVTGLRQWSHTIVITFVPTMFMFSGHSEIEAGRLLSFYLFTGTIGVLIGGYISDFISRKNLVVVSTFFSVIFFMLFFKTNGWTSLILIGFASAMLQSSMPATIVIAQNLMPKNSGLASGMMMGMTFGLGSLGTLFTGVIGDIYGLDFAVKSLIWILSLSGFAALWLPRKLIDN